MAEKTVFASEAEKELFIRVRVLLKQLRLQESRLGQEFEVRGLRGVIVSDKNGEEPEPMKHA